MAVHAVILGALVLAGVSEQDLVRHAEEVRACVHERLATQGERYGANLESFVVDSINDAYVERASLPPAEVCTSIVAAYGDGKRKLNESKKASPDLAAPGRDEIESDVVLVRFVQNGTGKHTVGHSDLTRRACELVGPPLDPDGDACVLLRSASQAPDFFHWYDDVFHAQTVEDGKSPQDVRVRESVARFREHVRELVTTSAVEARVGSAAKALFDLGRALHGVQDLVFHRGLTLRQHSGLSYYRKANPDAPACDGDPRFERAAVLSAQVIRRFAERVGDSWPRVVAWKRTDGFKYLNQAKEWTGKSEDIGVRGLVAYWALSLPYRFGRDASELDAGRATWDVERVMTEVLAP
jgi:hypothetical protein